ncbi:MAG: phospholipase D-like domain-containing protein [Candidatus Lokiarchaeia archaeon]
MVEEWNKFRDKIISLQNDLAPFQVDFLDRHAFSKFSHNLPSEVDGRPEIWITGYFSEAIRKALEEIMELKNNVKLISMEFNIDPRRASKRDRRNLEALKKLAEAGAEIRVNIRLHARFLVAHHPVTRRGFLLIGSFDFNTEGMGSERYDAGIKTRHPDLVKSAIELFEQIWNEPESISLEDFIRKGKS